MRTVPSVSSSEEEGTIKYVCGIDVGSQSCSGCICGPEKRVVVKSSDFANTKEGWKVWEEKLAQLDATPNQIIIGMEATSRYHENLYHELEQKGYQMRLLHPGQTHHFHQQQGRLTKTDRLDAMTIARALLSGEERVGYIPSEQIATYRELVRLHTQSLVRSLPAIRTRSRPWWLYSSPLVYSGLCRSVFTQCSGSAQNVSRCPGCGAGRSGGSVSGVASRPRSSFWSAYRQEIGDSGSDVQ